MSAQRSGKERQLGRKGTSREEEAKSDEYVPWALSFTDIRLLRQKGTDGIMAIRPRCRAT